MSKLREYMDVACERIPRAREELLDIASKADPATAKAIHDVVHGLMYRRPFQKPKARWEQAKITPDLVVSVRATLRHHPTMHNRDIGALHGIDGGRVSEIAQGLRTPDDPGMRRFR